MPSVHASRSRARRDGEEFLRIAPEVPVQSEVTVYLLEQANEALHDLHTGRLTGATVLQVEQPDSDV